MLKCQCRNCGNNRFISMDLNILEIIVNYMTNLNGPGPASSKYS